MKRLALAIALLGWMGAAAADLYRWVDPESGSVKFSSYPPPWYGDPATQRRAPKVEVIPERAVAPPPGPTPQEATKRESRPVAAGTGDRTADAPAGKTPDRRADGPADKPLDKRADGPADAAPEKRADKPAEPPEPDAMRAKRVDGR